MKCESILLIDIGNTSITIGKFNKNRIRNVERVSTRDCGVADIERAITSVAGKEITEGAAICSVVPAETKKWVRCLKKHTLSTPLLVSHALDLGVTIDYPSPASIGADRFANASAAAHKYGTPVIVADFGTALTFDVVSRDGKYIGGAIAPGLPLMTDYLAEKTALLPKIELKGPCCKMGKTTKSAMKIGAKIGYRGIVRETVKYLSESMSEKKVKLCATGGFARWALSGIDMPFVFDPDLTLYGLQRIYELNKEKSNA